MPHRPDVYSRWALEIRRKGYFHAGQRIGAAVSGGPDSVLLLHWLLRLKREQGLALAVVHFHHHLRGAESDGDEAFVRTLAESYQLEYFSSEGDVARVARERHGNLEAVARELRYRFFFSLVEQGRLDRVATAHTANDQAETVLLRLLRGAGLRGLGGIHPVLDGKVVRPFLSLTRDEVINEITAREIPYRVDSSNLNSRFRRNKVRLELLPLLAKEYNPEIVSLLSQFADRAREDEAYLERQARDRAQAWRVREGAEERFPLKVLREFPTALAVRVLRQMVQAAGHSGRGLTHCHLEALLRFCASAQSGKMLTLPRGIAARREFAWLAISQALPGEAPGGFSYDVPVPGRVVVSELGSSFLFKILKRDGSGEAYNRDQTAGLDPQKVGGKLVLRNWRAGDTFRPTGSQKTRKLKDLFREKQVPGGQRRLWPVVACGEQVVWVRGFPPAARAAASLQAAEMLIISEEPRPSRQAG